MQHCGVENELQRSSGSLVHLFQLSKSGVQCVLTRLAQSAPITVSLHISAAFLNSLHYQGLAHIFVFMRKSAMCQYCSYKLFETTLIFSYFAWKIRDRCSGLMKCANIHGKSKRRKPNLCRILPNLKVWHDQLFFQLSLNS